MTVQQCMQSKCLIDWWCQISYNWGQLHATLYGSSLKVWLALVVFLALAAIASGDREQAMHLRGWSLGMSIAVGCRVQCKGCLTECFKLVSLLQFGDVRCNRLLYEKKS